MGTVKDMRCVARFLRFLLPADEGHDEGHGDMLLRHAPSGAVLTAGSAGPFGEGPAVRFPSAAAAFAFSARFLDEAASWEPVPAARTEADHEPKAA